MNLSEHLYVFNQVMSNGKKSEGVSYYDDLFAWHDLDGYTCYLGYKDLTLTLYFHGRFAYNYQDEATYKAFDKIVTGMMPEVKRCA